MSRLFFASIVVLFLFLPWNAFADGVPIGPCGPSTGLDNRFQTLCDKSTSTPVGSVISNVLTILLVVAVLLSVFFLIWGGIKWIMSGGDKAAVDTARKTVIAAVVGLMLTFLTFFIMSFVFGIFGLNFGKLSLPELTTETSTCNGDKQYYDSASNTCKSVNATYCGNISEVYDSTTGTCKASSIH